ncbi:MAG: carbohydrate binding domain-containing protein, partial [Actinocrinis sp.]
MPSDRPPRRTGLKRKQLYALGAALAALLLPAAVYLAAAPASAASNLLANPGFEAGSLSGWSCDAGTGSVVTTPVRSGGYA